MDMFKRYAVYYAPRPGEFCAAAARWLGRDAETGAYPAQPEVAGMALPDLTASPRRYGFHGTLRAPFRPAPGLGLAEIADAVESLAATLGPARAEGLEVISLHGFVALVPRGDRADINALAAQVVRGTNALRAPLSDADIARRRPDSLTQRQAMHLAQWGYPYVLDDFSFHLTLSDHLPDPDALLTAARAHFAPCLPAPFAIEDLCLFAEDDSGLFHLVRRIPLHG